MATIAVIPHANAMRSTFCVELRTAPPRGRRPRIFADLDIRIVDTRQCLDQIAHVKPLAASWAFS
jgi:hypothetical protein